MAYSYDVNNVGGANGGAEVMLALKDLLVSVGWDVPAWSDGLTYNVVGGITHAGSGANGLNNSRAWMRLRAPSGMSPRREFCLQRGTGGNTTWWIKVSAEDGFTVGGDVDDMPTATDEANLHGSGVAGLALFGTASTYKFHLGADAASPYAWWLVALVNGTGVTTGVLIFEPLATAGSPTADDDKAVYHASAAASGLATSVLCSSSAGPYGWYKKDLSGETWCRMVAHQYYSSSYGYLVPSGTGTNPYDSDDNHFPIAFGRGPSASTQIGWKGFGTQMRWLGPDRANGDTLSTLGVRDRIVIDDVVLPWPDVVPSI